MVHWEVPLAVVRPLVPPLLAIDTFEGRAFVGVVPFAMRDVRFGPLPIPGFLETNVRTYVHAAGVPGVWFLSLDAASALAAAGGRTLYHLPYFLARMQCDRRGDSLDYRLRRASRRRAHLEVSWTPGEDRQDGTDPDSLAFFLTARFALYGSRAGSAYRLRVHHPDWPLRRARIARLETSLLDTAGVTGGRLLDDAIASPRGVAVETFAPEPL